MELTTAAVLELAPDEGSIKAARALSVPGKWPALGHVEDILWGECRGSGSKPYQVCVDISGPVFKCSCPSRKFPCKHVLALLLLQTEQTDALRVGEPPTWVGEWLVSRRQRAERQEQKRERKAGASDAAAAKRGKVRLQRMTAGVEELSRWMGDVVRNGMGSLTDRWGTWQEELAARMVDAQLPGLAARLRALGSLRRSEQDWPVHLLSQFGRLQLLIDAFARLDVLPEAEQYDVRAALGLLPEKEWVLANGERVDDAWLVMGVCCAEEGKLWSRRVWLRGGKSGRIALLLDFSYGNKQFEGIYSPGTVWDMELAFYPGRLSQRALISGRAVKKGQACPPSVPLWEALDGLARGVAAQPWQWPVPLLIGGCVPCRLSEDRWELLSEEGAGLPLSIDGLEGDEWALLAASGGRAVDLWGEWDGSVFTPLSAWMPDVSPMPVWRRS